MRTFLKVALGLIGVGLLLLVALIIAVTLMFEPNDYRPYLVDAVEQATGRSFELQGDLGLNVLPCCSVSLGAARLGSPAGFPEPAFASLDSASLRLRLWPLLTRQEVQVGTVTLAGVDVSLVRLADGQVNWTFDSDQPAAAAPAGEPSTPLALSVDRVVLTDGRVRYQDRQAALDYTVSGLELDTGFALNDDQVVVTDPTLAFTVTGADLPDPVSLAVTADSLTANLADGEDVTIDEFRVDVRTLGAHLRLSGSGRAAAFDLRGDLELAEISPRMVLAALSDDPYQPADPAVLERMAVRGNWALVGNALTLDQLTLQLDDSTLSGSAAVTDLEAGTVRFELTLDQIDLDAYLAAAGPAEPVPSPGAEPTVLPLADLAGLPVQGSLRIGRLSSSGMDVSDLTLSLDSDGATARASLSAAALGGTFSVEGGGNVAAAAPVLAGRLRIDGVTPRQALAAAGTTIETADPNVLRQLDGTADWRLTPRSAALDNVRLKLDDTGFSGNVGVTDFDTLAARFDLAIDRMNLDGYLPPDSAPSEEAQTDASPIPVELIRGLTLQGRLRATELVVMDITLRDLLAEAHAADGLLRLDPVSAGLYGGTYRGSVAVDATGSVARITLDQTLSAVQVSEVLSRFFDSDLLGGSLSLGLSGTGTGNTSSELLRGLAADVSFDLSDGVYRGMNVLYQVQKARAMLKNEPPPAPPESPETAIRALRATGRMMNGVLQTSQLQAETDALRLQGSGGINLLDLALDYQLNARVLSAAAASAKLGDLADVSIPLTIAGPLRAPKVGVDLTGMLTSTLRDTAQNKARQALLDRLGDGKDAKGGGAPQGSGGSGTSDAGASQAAPADASTDQPGKPSADKPADKPSTRDLLKQGLRDLIKPQEQKSPETSAPPPASAGDP